MDARRRRLERDVELGGEGRAARAALLRERVRAGDLSGDRLLLARHLGDEAAGDALGPGGAWAPPGRADGGRGGDAWFRALGAISEEVALRAALAVAALAEPFRRALEEPGARARHGLERGCAWAAAACSAPHEAAAVERARLLAREQRTFAERYGPGSELKWHIDWTCRCASVGLAAAAAPGLVARLGDPLALPWLADARDLTGERVREALERALLPWALGREDAS